MQKIKFFLMFFLGICCFFSENVEGILFEKDVPLVNKLKENKVRLIVMRQAEANNNTKKIITSARTPGFCLTSKGHKQINDLLPLYLTKDIIKIFTSPLYRCLQSTQLFGEGLDLPIDNLVVDDRLVIQEFGIYERYSYKVYDAMFPTVPSMLEAELEGMESGASVFERTNSFLWHIATNVVDKTVLIVTHAFNYCHISKCLTNSYGRLPYPGSYAIYDYSDNDL